jgi:hypothetical protein
MQNLGFIAKLLLVLLTLAWFGCGVDDDITPPQINRPPMITWIWKPSTSLLFG